MSIKIAAKIFVLSFFLCSFLLGESFWQNLGKNLLGRLFSILGTNTPVVALFGSNFSLVFSFISLLLLCTVNLKTFNFLRFRNEGSLLTLDQRMMNKSQRAFHKVIFFLVFAFQGFLFRNIMINYSSNSNCIPSFLNFNFKLLFKVIVKNIIL